MSIDLGQLKSILETAKNLQMGNIKDLTTLNGVIQRYNQIAHNNGNTQELPVVFPYDEDLDLDTFYTSFTTSGTSKLTDIITYAEGYIIAHTPIPSTINKIEGWSGNKFWGLTALIVTICAAICFGLYGLGKDIGQQNADPVCKNKNDSLQVLIKSTSRINDELTNSLKEFELTKESLQNARNKTITLSDSLDKIIALNDSLKKQVQDQISTIDSIKKEADAKGRSSSLFYDEWMKTRDSLHSNILCNRKGLKK